MGEITKIEWTDRTWNPWVGCTKVSEGCAHCYAEALDKRFHSGAHWGKGAARERTSDANWKLPHKWNREAERSGKRIKVFCASMADWLDPEVPIEWFADLLDVIRQTPWLDWQLLTKRPELWRERLLACMRFIEDKHIHGSNLHTWILDWCATNGSAIAPSNVWVGCSAENQERLEERVPHLLRIPAKVRFLSCEPLLVGLDLPFPTNREAHEEAAGMGLAQGFFDISKIEPNERTGNGIHWVIVGGESGPRARECNLAWIEDIVKQCREAKVPVFVKQLGSNAIRCDPDGDMEWPTEDAKGGDMDEWPETLRVREFPVVKGVRDES